MKVVAFSDTHEKHKEFTIPDGDILVFAGDLTMIGERKAIKDFNEWLGELPHKHKLVMAGNHDRTFEMTPSEVEPLITNARYVKDELVEVEGVKLFFSPWTPPAGSDYWKFHIWNREARAKHWEVIPESLDILVTHGPASRILDWCDAYAGDAELGCKIHYMDRPPKYHIFGHIHEQGGKSYTNLKTGTIHYNVALVDRLYRPVNQPLVLEVMSCDSAKAVASDQPGQQS